MLGTTTSQHEDVGWNLPATGKQKHAIFRLCTILTIREEVEQKAMTRMEARNLIHDLRKQLRRKNA